MRLLLKKMGKGVSQSVVSEEHTSLNIRMKRVTQLLLGRGHQDPAGDRVTKPTSLYQWRECLRCRKCDQVRQNAHCNASTVNAFDTRSVTGYAPGTSRVGRSNFFGGGSFTREQLHCCVCAEQSHDEISWLLKWEERKESLGKQATQRGRKNVAKDQLAAPKAHRP